MSKELEDFYLDRRALAPSLRTSTIFAWVTGDIPPTSADIDELYDDDARYKPLALAFDSMQQPRKDASESPLTFLCHFLLTFPQFFQPGDWQDLEGGWYADFAL